MIGRTLAARLTLLQQVIAIAVVALFAGSSLWVTARVLERRETALLSEAADRIARHLEFEFGEDHDLNRAAHEVLAEEADSGVHADIVDSSGRLLATTRLSGSSKRTRSAASSGRAAQHASARTPFGSVVKTSLNSPVRSTALSALGQALAATAIPLLLVTLLLNRWTTRRALRPLAAMEERARQAPLDSSARILVEPTGLAEIDELGRSFDRLLQRIDELRQAERRFSSDASHELRTPLTVLSLELEMALGRPGIPAEARPGLKRAFDQVTGMRELVEALLLLSRSLGGATETRATFEPVNLADLAAEGVVEIRRRHCDRAADLELRAPDEALVAGRPELLASALRNLVDNAIAFTRPGQPVRVTVASGQVIDVVVDDGGPGIPPEERERVFDPFYRGAEARATRRGFGLGLPILRQMARVHGGDVTIESSPLGGARFTLHLPPWRASGAPEPQAT